MLVLTLVLRCLESFKIANHENRLNRLANDRLWTLGAQYVWTITARGQEGTRLDGRSEFASPSFVSRSNLPTRPLEEMWLAPETMVPRVTYRRRTRYNVRTGQAIFDDEITLHDQREL